MDGVLRAVAVGGVTLGCGVSGFLGAGWGSWLGLVVGGGDAMMVVG